MGAGGGGGAEAGSACPWLGDTDGESGSPPVLEAVEGQRGWPSSAFSEQQPLIRDAAKDAFCSISDPDRLGQAQRKTPAFFPFPGCGMGSQGGPGLDTSCGIRSQLCFISGLEEEHEGWGQGAETGPQMIPPPASSARAPKSGQVNPQP